MLRWLRIHNLAVIEDLTWELDEGFNVLTGETGAGKSILIDAFNLLLGERADKTLIRDGSDGCSVEAVLDVPEGVEPMLEEQGIEWSGGDGLILRRQFTRQGQNRQFVNGSATTLQFLKTLGDLLVDMHGPHDHQSLLSNDSQRAALDAFAKAAPELEAYRALYHEQQREMAELEELRSTDAGDWEKKLDYLNFQIEEIERAGVSPGEDEELDREYRLASHSQRIVEISSSLAHLLNEAEDNLYQRLAEVERLLSEWERIDPQAAALREMSGSALAQLRELERESDSLAARTEVDGARLAELEERLDLIQSLKRKHGPTLENVLATLEALTAERDSISGREGRIRELEASIQKRRGALGKAAEKLGVRRAKAAPLLSKDITAQLRDLGFKKAEFGVRLESRETPGASGADRVEFLFAPNPGESARPLKAIASSGEMARVMLAVKTVLAAQDAVPILVFDEVDANVGGETAVSVGQKLAALGAAHQVLCITHLPQVAAAGRAHFRVQKEVEKGRTHTQVERLGKAGREQELARMLGGASKSSLAMARSLLAGE